MRDLAPQSHEAAVFAASLLTSAAFRANQTVQRALFHKQRGSCPAHELNPPAGANEEDGMAWTWEVITTLVSNMMKSTPQGFLGVGLIFIYLVWMVSMATRRIAENLKEDHHH